MQYTTEYSSHASHFIMQNITTLWTQKSRFLKIKLIIKLHNNYINNNNLHCFIKDILK